MRVLVAPDSFKGSMSAVEVCDITRRALEASLDECQVDCIPVADGGEGTLDSFVFACGATLFSAKVTAPDYRRVDAEFAVMSDTAIIEMAQASGLPLTGKFIVDIVQHPPAAVFIIDRNSHAAEAVV